MIAQLAGTVAEIDGHDIILDVNGVGYGITVSYELVGRVKEAHDMKLYIYEHIREQEHTLYGFESKNDQSLFNSLLSVNGIGPKAALAIFDLAEPDILRSEIASGNIAFLTQASGVGKKAAERVVVDLQDKVGALSHGYLQSRLPSNDEAVEGLVALGYTTEQAQHMLTGIDAVKTEDRIKQALKKA
jgi:Holliday junction DNA helicase RuvA